MTATTTSKSRASRAADKAQEGQPQTGQQETGQPKPEAKQPAKPEATVDLGAYSYTMHQPVVTGPDGVQHKCPHRWGHEAEKVAMACARRLAAQAGLTVK